MNSPKRLRTRLRTPTGRLTAKVQRMLDSARAHASTFKNKLFGQMYIYAVEKVAYHDDYAFLNFIKALREPPVDIETFIDSPDFLGATDLTLWPEVRKAAIELNRYWWKGYGNGAYKELVACRATGSGKSELCKVTAAYHLHILGCMKNPQEYYKLPSSTSVVFVVQAAKPHVTKKIIYTPLRNYVETMPWFQRHMRPNKYMESEMYFEDQNIRVVPGGCDSDAILGEAILFAIIDEINFMNVVQKSKKAGIGTGKSATYDQAQSIYDAVTRRRKSRFLSKGPQVGMICLSSSTRYKGDFTDKREKYAKENNDTQVYIYAKAQYEVVPKDRFCGETFLLYVGNDSSRDIRILGDDDKVYDIENVLEIPIEYKEDFQKDPHGSLRDIAGVSLGSVNPFFRQRSKVMDCVVRGEAAGLQSFLHKDNVVLGLDGMPSVIHGHFCRTPNKPRYVHIDLSINSDRCGVAMARFDGMTFVDRGYGGETELLPMVTIEMAVSIEPDMGNEIDGAEIRAWVNSLRTVYGYPIKAVSYDNNNMSIESRQAWKKKGMKTNLIQIDRSPTPHKQFRDAIYDGRINMYEQPVLLDEIFNLEFDEENGPEGKIDHPVNGSKDVYDAVVGSYITLLTRSASWVMPFGEGGIIDMDSRADADDRFDESERS